MATRKKTIRFAADTFTTTVADAVLTQIASLTLYIPETTRTITSAFAVVSCMDLITATGGTINEWRVALQLGGAAAVTVTDTNDITNTGENMSFVLGPLNFTSNFTSNFGAGASQTCLVSLYMDQNTGTTLGMTNSTVEIFITYTYDDTAATHIKTVVLPLESPAAALGTTSAQIGTNQIPILTGASGILPEVGVNIRSYYFIIESNEHGGTSAVDVTFNVSLEGGTPTKAFGLIERALATNRFDKFIWAPAAVPDTTVTHQFYAWSASVAMFNHMSIALVVTYEYTVAGTTRILNSVQLPLECPSPSGNTAATDNSRISRNLYIEEPGTITLRQSGVQLCWNELSTVTGLRVRAGAQAYRAYTSNTSVLGGGNTLMQRIDSGSSLGVGATIARGLNTVDIDIYGTSATAFATNISGVMYLNYESDVPAAGPGVANHTLYEMLSQYTSLAQTSRYVTGYQIVTPETLRWLGSVGFWFISSTTGPGGFNIVCQKASGTGWEPLYTDVLFTDAEFGTFYTYVQAGDVFMRHPTDQDRLDPATARKLAMVFSVANRFGLVTMYSYHSNTYTVSGTVTGYTGDGSGITVSLVRDYDDIVRNVATTTVGGTYSMTWYDDVEDIHCEVSLADRAGRSISAGVGD